MTYPIINQAVLAFFENHQDALEIYKELTSKIIEEFPDTFINVQKSQISYKNKHIFACVSFNKPIRKALLPNPYLTLTLGLNYPLDSPVVAYKCEPYPGRWTTHIVLAKKEDINDQLMALILDAYLFADTK